MLAHFIVPLVLAAPCHAAFSWTRLLVLSKHLTFPMRPQTASIVKDAAQQVQEVEMIVRGKDTEISRLQEELRDADARV